MELNNNLSTALHSISQDDYPNVHLVYPTLYLVCQDSELLFQLSSVYRCRSTPKILHYISDANEIPVQSSTIDDYFPRHRDG
jgi:hypothetical protein